MNFHQTIFFSLILFITIINQTKTFQIKQSNYHTHKLYYPIPEEFDWRKKDIIGEIEDEGDCIASYAFVSIDGIESYLKLIRNMNIKLSVQQIIDCSTDFKNFGCINGSILNSFDYIGKYGLQNEESYTYADQKQNCLFDISKVVIEIPDYIIIHPETEDVLKELVYSIGPQLITIQVDKKFFDYKNGIYESNECSESKSTRNLLIVGYGVEDNIQYWILKGYWGKSWGENGYIRIRRNYNNMCGIANTTVFPEIKPFSIYA